MENDAEKTKGQTSQNLGSDDSKWNSERIEKNWNKGKELEEGLIHKLVEKAKRGICRAESLKYNTKGFTMLKTKWILLKVL